MRQEFGGKWPAMECPPSYDTAYCLQKKAGAARVSGFLKTVLGRSDKTRESVRTASNMRGTSMAKTILITGVSSGLGLAMANAALAREYRVLGTLRDESQRSEFESRAPGRAFGRLLDVTQTAEIQPLIDAMEEEHGPIDVLINNAGYGLRGVVEELKLEELRRQFEVNVFAPIALIQAVLPKMRMRRAGHIVSISSMGGVITFPGLGAYHGSKFAILGLSDALAQEVQALGVHVISVLPGVYRSDWNGRSQAHVDHTIVDYDSVLEAAKNSDLKWGDPAALGEVVMDAIAMEEPPRHLLVGPTAIRMIRRHLDEFAMEIKRWETLSNANGEG